MAELIPSRLLLQVAARDQEGAFIRKKTYEVDAVNSVNTLDLGQYRAILKFWESVETLHSEAEMPKRKSGQQAERWSE